MANFSLTVPNEKATFRFAFRDTGGSWSADQIMVGGAGDPDKTFSSPVCDELRLTIDYASASTFDRVHFSNLSIISGLSFSVDYGAGSTSYSQATELRPKASQNQTIRTPESSSTSQIILIITGIAQRAITFDQVIFGKTDWIPASNFEDQSVHRQSNRYSRQRTKSSSKNRLEDNARILPLIFLKLTEAEYLDLQHLCDTVSVNGYMLAELDSGGGSEHDSFLAECSISGYSSQAPDLKQCQLQLIEKNTQ